MSTRTRREVVEDFESIVAEAIEEAGGDFDPLFRAAVTLDLLGRMKLEDAAALIAVRLDSRAEEAILLDIFESKPDAIDEMYGRFMAALETELERLAKIESPELAGKDEGAES